MRNTYLVLLAVSCASAATAQPPSSTEPTASRLTTPGVTTLAARSLGGPTPVSPEEAARNTALQKEQIALSRAALKLIGQGNFAGALAQYEKMEALTPEAGVPRVLIGNMLFRLGKYDEAIAAYKTALERGKHSPSFVAPQAYTGLGELYAATERTDDAIAAYRQVVYRTSDHDWRDNDGKSIKAKVMHSKDDWTTSQGNEPQVLMRYALVLSRAGRYDEAIRVYQWGLENIPHPNRDLFPQTFSAQAFDRHPFEASAHTALGLTDPHIIPPYEDASIAEYHLAIASDRFFAPAHYFLGNALEEKGLKTEAKASWQKAVETGRGETKIRAQKAIEQR